MPHQEHSVKCNGLQSSETLSARYYEKSLAADWVGEPCATVGFVDIGALGGSVKTGGWMK